MKYLLGALACVASSAVAHAGVDYQYIAVPASTSLSVGQSVSVNIYLQETLTDGANSLLLSEHGLFGVGYHIELSSGSGASFTNFAPDAALSKQFMVKPFGVIAGVDVSAVSGPVGVDSGVNQRLVSVGTLTVTPASATGDYIFSVGPIPDPYFGANTITLLNSYDLDAGGIGYNAATGSTFALHVNAVPEPASLGILIGSFALLARRRKA